MFISLCRSSNTDATDIKYTLNIPAGFKLLEGPKDV